MANMLNKNAFYEYEKSGELVIIIRPSLACNAACAYCSAASQNNVTLSPYNTATAIKNTIALYKELNSSEPQRIDILFHGGEPMLLGKSYVTELANLIDKQITNTKICYGMQTNLLLYEGWRNILGSQLFSWRITSSYDFHASFRRTENGDDYFSAWYDKVKRYQDDSGRRLYTICVLSRENVDYVEDIVREAYELGLDIRLEYLYPAGRAMNMNHTTTYLTPQEYGNAIIRAYNTWKEYSDKEYLYVQGNIFESSVRNGCAVGCPFSSRCFGRVFCIMPNGNFYNCPLCADMSLCSFGNAVTNNINYENIATMKVAEIAFEEECYLCGICNGGCKKDKLLTGKNKTPFCDSYKKFHNIVTQKLNQQVGV